MRVVLDVNIYISYGIGKALADLPRVMGRPDIQIFTCEALFEEILRVAAYPKLQKYLPPTRITEIVELVHRFGELIPIGQTSNSFADAKDVYLLDLCDAAQADFLVTGDRLLLELQQHNQTRIITYKIFQTILP